MSQILEVTYSFHKKRQTNKQTKKNLSTHPNNYELYGAGRRVLVGKVALSLVMFSLGELGPDKSKGPLQVSELSAWSGQTHSVDSHGISPVV